MTDVSRMEHAAEILAAQPIAPKIKPSAVEHASTLRIANALMVLDTFSTQMRRPQDHLLDEVAITAIGTTVDDVFETQAVKDFACVTAGKRPYDYKVRALSYALRSVWHQTYYQERSHPTTKAEYQDWVQGYVDRYGESSRLKTMKTLTPFDTMHRSKSTFEQTNDKAMRTADADILLIQGIGNQAVTTLEMPGTTVRNALSPGTIQHNKVYSLDIPPQQWHGNIYIPGDIFINTPSIRAIAS